MGCVLVLSLVVLYLVWFSLVNVLLIDWIVGVF